MGDLEKDRVNSGGLARFLAACSTVTSRRLDRPTAARVASLGGSSAEAGYTARTCSPPALLSGPEQTLEFREDLSITVLPIRDHPPHDDVQEFPVFLGCDLLSRLNVTVGTALIYQQRWFFRRQALGSISSTIALAPGEKIRLSVTRTQRKQLTQTTLDEVERATSSDSTFVDRDVVNVTRSSSATNNWNVSGGAQITIPKINLGVNLSGGFSRSVNRASTATAERVREATRKSSSSLKLLSKIEVQEITETTETGLVARTIINPYRDRSLLLNIYDLNKEYDVEFSLEKLSPTLTLEVNFDFGRDFVLRNGDFLAQSLRDRILQVELANALEVVVDLPSDEDSARKAASIARQALKYLFDVPNMFFIAEEEGVKFDRNIPEICFKDSHQDKRGFNSGLEDARGSKYGILFTILNFYFLLYKDKKNEDGEIPASADDFVLELALSLHSACQPLWAGDQEEVNRVLDREGYTEIFRRLGGFLAFVGGVLQPLMVSSDEENATPNARRRAEFVIKRVQDHLNCHKKYYSRSYLEYLSSLTKSVTLQDFVAYVVENVLESTVEIRQFLQALFDPANLFTNGNDIVVPCRCELSDELVQQLLDALGQPDAGEGIEFGVLSSDTVLVPTDGAHIEPIPGSCVLDVCGKGSTSGLDYIGTWLVLGPIFDPAQQVGEHDADPTGGNEPDHAWAERLILGIDELLDDFDPAVASASLDTSPKEGDAVTYGGDGSDLPDKRTYVWRRRSFSGMNWANIHEIDNNIHFHLYGDADDPFDVRNYSNFAGKHHAFAFFTVYIESPDDRARRIYVRSDDSLRAWLNGAEVLELQRVGERDIGPGEDVADLPLKKGWNILIVAVAETHVDWALSVRIESSADLRITTTHPAMLYAGWPSCSSEFEFICVAGEGNLWNARDPQRLLQCVGNGIWRGRIRMSKEQFKFVANADLENLNWGSDGTRGGPNFGPLAPGLYDVSFDENNPGTPRMILITSF